MKLNTLRIIDWQAIFAILSLICNNSIALENKGRDDDSSIKKKLTVWLLSRNDNDFKNDTNHKNNWIERKMVVTFNSKFNF